MESDFWKSHNHCPYCRMYLIQGGACDMCKWMYPVKVFDYSIDKFEPTEECIRILEDYERVKE